MKSNVPWSVKGIDPEARVVAKEAARKAGMTLGEWMTSMIHDVGVEDAAHTPKPTADTGVPTEQLRAVVDSLNRLNERLKSTEENVKRSEEKSREAVGGLNQGLETVFERLKRVEREKAAGAPGNIVDRVEKLETSDVDRDRIQSLKALEHALTQMVDQFDATRKEAILRVEKNEQAVAALESKVDVLDTRVTASFQEVHDALDTVGHQLDHTERTAKAVMLEAREAANSADEEFVERTAKKLQLLGNEIKRSGDQISAVESLVGSLSEKIEAAEHRSAEGIAEVAGELNALRDDVVPALEANATDPEVGKAAAEAEATVAQLQKSYEDMLARLEGHEANLDAAGPAEADPAPAPLMATAPPQTEMATAPEAQPDPAEEAYVARSPEDYAEADMAAADPAAVDEEFDEIFGNADDGEQNEDEATADAPQALTPREKILAAAKARKERLERERQAQDEAAEADAAQAVPDFTAGEGAQAAGDDEKEGQNRKIGLPLVALLGLLVAGMIGAGVFFFGMNKGDSPAPGTEQVIEDGDQSAAGSDSVDMESVTPSVLSTSATPDGATLYRQGKNMLASAASLEDRVAAFTTIREAAIYGNVPAQYRLGEMYFTGTGTEQNLPNAKRWFTEAALSGNAAAMHRLGTLAIDPQIDGQNFSLALEWFGRAANYGVIDSMYNLGFLYDPGSDLLPLELRSASESYYWYALAARQGDPQAPIDGANVAGRLTPEQVTQIDDDVLTWVPLPNDPAVNDGLQIVN